MSRHLLIMRHAKSDWDSGASTDFERPLSKRGQHDAPMMGEWMHSQGLKPDHILSSPATRAKTTASLVCETLDIPISKIEQDQRIYEASLDDLLNILKEQPADTETVLLVGHNPGMDELVTYLCGNDTQRLPYGNLMPTAALAHLLMPNDWTDLKLNCAQLHSLTRPKDIKAIEQKQ